jgi:major type 1 subunit fimbrin (pilin)
MKAKSLALIFAVFSTSYINSSYAADGTVNFTGNIRADACTVSATSQTLNVALGTVSATSFSSVGDKTSSAPFQIQLTACPPTVTSVAVRFDGVSDDTNPDLLKLDSGQTATGVGIEIADSSGAPIPLHVDSVPYTVDGGTNAVDMDFNGRYVSTSLTVGAGTANATSQFTIMYP